MQMLNGFYLIRADDEARQTKSGILITQGALRLPQTGTIIEAPRGSVLKVGSRVSFLRYSTIDTDDPKVKIAKLDHIVGVLDENS